MKKRGRNDTKEGAPPLPRWRMTFFEHYVLVKSQRGIQEKRRIPGEGMIIPRHNKAGSPVSFALLYLVETLAFEPRKEGGNKEELRQTRSWTRQLVVRWKEKHNMMICVLL
mmetsp:Transcript_43181/g.85143  ORF Transcript_43181/g.85143 Transcript_43181/m.85143 type:complete len:111 (-) Transcript_43181:1027-1359(-)